MDLKELLAEHGLFPKDIIENGEMQRFDVEEKNDKAGFYKVFPDGGGVFGNWKSGLKKTFGGGQVSDLTPEVRAQFRENARKANEKRKLAYARAAQTANDMWAKAKKADPTHPYLVRKNIKPFGIKQEGNKLLIPVRDENRKLVSLQMISPDGTKMFLKDSRTAGCYHAFGEVVAGKPLYVCEGYATAATIHDASGCAAVVSFTANNAFNVGNQMSKHFPKAMMTVVADNDQFTTRADGTPWNPGVDAAMKLAEETGAAIIIPEFHAEAGKGATDFNDYAALYGTKKLVENYLTPLSSAPEPEPAPVVEQLPAVKQWRAIDYFSSLPHTRGNANKPMATIENLAEILDRCGMSIRYNVITRKQELTIPGFESVSDTFDGAVMAELVSQCKRFNFPTEYLEEFLVNLAGRNPYNPVNEWILSKPWDGVDRLEEFYATVESTNEDLKKILMKRWMVSAVAAAFRPDGVTSKGVLVFQGAQNLGKTSWFLRLVPDEIRHLIKDAVTLRIDDKDSVYECIRHWLVELGELEGTFKKSDIAQIKGFIGKNRDNIRTPYSRKAAEYPRRTIFFASVNEQEFLHDTTGNVRFWCIECTKIDYLHTLDMQQIWRQFYNLYTKGEKWHLLPSENAMLRENNEDFETSDPICEKLALHYHWEGMPLATTWITATQALSAIGMHNPTKGDVSRAGMYIKKRNGGQAKRLGGARLLLVPGTYRV